MAVWGEQVLPVAPAAFWSLFVERLRRAGRLQLLVKWLPFNDRSKVSRANGKGSAAAVASGMELTWMLEYSFGRFCLTWSFSFLWCVSPSVLLCRAS